MCSIFRTVGFAANPVAPPGQALTHPTGFHAKEKLGLAKQRSTRFAYFGKGFKFDKQEDVSMTQDKLQQAQIIAETTGRELDVDDSTMLSKTTKQEPKMKARVLPRGMQVLTPGYEEHFQTHPDYLHQVRMRKKREEPVSVVTRTKDGLLTAEELQRRAKQFAAALTTEGMQSPRPAKPVHLECEVEINDLPASIRARICRKEMLETLSDRAGCPVTMRGDYFPPHTAPRPGESRLHFFLETSSHQAMVESISLIAGFIRDLADELGEDLRSVADTQII
eukprot:gnl/Chilomastix_cuspidata/1130.p1 GENE.gnl/Chilomastix_cuspidata/1130~~gnl/Chilomastix_cuspidata/1130.p1  ORF type:complete len:279 (-),score=78.44 gnl/Chilomastix_cuspidata/1130:26-862(-)